MAQRHPVLEDGSRWCKRCESYCPAGHFGKWTNALCREHMQVYSRERHRRNGDPKAAERQRKRREAKTEGYLAAVKRSNERQKTLGWPAHKQWRSKNEEQQREYSREYQRRWYRENPDKAARKRHRRRAREAEAPGFHTTEELHAKRVEYDGLCVYCGEDSLWIFDHLIPLARGGSNFIWNLAPACRSCNSKKNASDPEAYITGNARTPEIRDALLAAVSQGRALSPATHLRQTYEKVPLQSLVDDVRRVLEETGKVTETTLQSHGRFAVSTYRRRIGGMATIREVIQ